MNASTTKTIHPHEPLCLHNLSNERAEVLRRLKRQLEQAQRDLERAQCEQNHNAIIRLRYRIIPQLEQQIRRLIQDARSLAGNPSATLCFKATWHIEYIYRSAISHALFSEASNALLDMNDFYSIIKEEKRQW